MLTPEYLETCTDDIVSIYDQLQTAILCDMVRRIVRMGKISESSAYQLDIYQESGGVLTDALSQIAKTTNLSEKAVKELFEDAGAHTLLYDDKIYKAAGLNPIPLTQSPSMLNILVSGMNKTNGNLSNLTLTTANISQQAFIKAANEAYYNTISGGMSYNEAIKKSIYTMDNANGFVSYPTGHKDRIDVATRRATLTGVNQTTLEMQWKRADELESDLVEVSAHGGARPSHSVWQGKIYSRSGKSSKYPDFVSSTGYGTGAGLGGWNCRHSYFPYFNGSPRAYSDADLEALEEKKYNYNGKDYSLYDITQKQRAIERAIRERKRTLTALNEGIKNTADEATINTLKAEFTKKSISLKEQESKLKDLLSQTGVDRENNREQVKGFGRSEAMKAVWAAKKGAT